MQFQKLEELGYQGFALGFYEEATELVGTGATVNLFSAPLIEYLHAIIIAGKEVHK